MIVPEMEPLIPQATPQLEELVTTILKRSAMLVGRLPHETAGEIRKLLCHVNSYYSNLIEGAYTKLKDIERAVKDDLDADEKTRKLQLLHKAHIAAQRHFEEEIKVLPRSVLTEPQFLSQFHWRLFKDVPEDFLVQRTADGNTEIQMVPGQLRDHDVEVGKHIPVPPERLGACLKRFDQGYSLEKLSPSKRLIAAAASHHRLLWIHPFLEGNGRVARMFTDLYLTKAGLDGYGLWTMSRGLAREEKRYKAMLASADVKRQGDYDGRGALSEKALQKFCLFFLETAFDQIEFMRELLSIDSIHKNVALYLSQRVNGSIPGQSILPKEAGVLYEHVFTYGKIIKGEVHELLNVSQRKATTLAKTMVQEGLLQDDGKHRAPYRVGFPAEAVEYLFPMLVR